MKTRKGNGKARNGHVVSIAIAKAAHIQTAALKRLRVCIVDDEESVRVSVKMVVESTGTYQVVGMYATGLDALQGIPMVRPHIVLMDIMMKGMSGLEAGHRLKDILPAIKLIMLTAVHDRKSVSEATSFGADSYITKPFSNDQLLAQLDFVSARSKTNGFALPADSFESTVNGTRLTAREYEFLQNLAAAHSHQVIAANMGIGYWRVHKLQRQVYKKLRVGTAIEAVLKFSESIGFRGILAYLSLSTLHTLIAG